MATSERTNTECDPKLPSPRRPDLLDGLNVVDSIETAIMHAIAENTEDLIMVLDREGRIRFINRPAPDLTLDQVLGMPAHLFLPPDYHATALDCLERVALTGRADGYEVAYVGSNGDSTCWHARVGPVLEDGQVVGFVVVGRNLTELRKEAFERDRFFNLSIDMLCIAGPEGKLERVNPAFERTLGYSSPELLEMKVLDLVHPDDRERVREAANHLRAGQNTFNFESRYRRKDGEYRWLSWRAVAEPSGGRIYGVARDITEHRQLQAQLQHSQKLDAIGQLAGGVAHDFNNLLLAIRINTEAAREQAASPDRVQLHLDQIREAAQRASELTRQLLTFARHQPLHTRALDVCALGRDLHELLRRLLPENIEIVLEPYGEACVVDADPAQLEQVLLNLCVNARDAMPGGGTLRITIEPIRLDHRFCVEHSWAKPGRYVVLRVSDTGAGMAPEVQARVFEPFFSTKPQGIGTGLGLATAYGVVQRHGGLLHVRSAPGLGSSFEVYLPHSNARSTVFVEPQAHDTPEGGSETILIAEDDPLVRAAVVHLLEYFGYNVLVAKDGVDAIEVYRRFEHDIDLLMLDITMPRLSGPKALEEIRKLNPHVRAIFTSGYASMSHPVARDAVLHKPYDPNTLLRRIRTELGRMTAPALA
jgi:two-component system, cell cycle sensor histidine kinase and response regulator CckA